MNVMGRAGLIFLCMVLTGCGSWVSHYGLKQTGSVVEFLYPNAQEPPKLTPTMTTLRLPVRVGIAFVPGAGSMALPETERAKLLERVKSSFSEYDFIGKIEVIPSAYLRPKGGFVNLDQVARMFNVDVVALLSYDQMQFNDSNALSVLYWTIIGAYVIHGNQYDIQTMLDASVFDVRSRKLLFRAPGTHQIKGSASMAGVSEAARAARLQGYEQAVADLVPKLKVELESFKERVKSDASIRVENRPGYTGRSGGGDWGYFGLGVAGVVAGVFAAGFLLARRRRR